MDEDGVFTKMKNNEFTDAKCAMPELNVCSAAHNTFGINPYGELMPCILSQVSAGSLLKDSLKDLWYNSSVLKEWREIKLKDIYKCNKCKLRTICVICPANQLLENKALKPVRAMCESAYLTNKYIKKEVQNGKAHKENRKASQETLCKAYC
jgi:radical SAM protein with 4Fe4S-binding SPASM domain